MVVKAGTGIAELIALEMSKRVLVCYIALSVVSHASVFKLHDNNLIFLFYFSWHRQIPLWKSAARRFG